VFSTQFHTLDELVAMFSEACGHPPPRLKVPPALMATVTGLYAGTFARFFPNMPQRLTPGAIRILRMRRHADLTKAKTELGYKPTDIRSAIFDAFEFYARSGMVAPEAIQAIERSLAKANRLRDEAVAAQ
jgi:nucleoside-diphosphate-sugar epimerase